MPDFQLEIDEAKQIALRRGHGRLTFGWTEHGPEHPLNPSAGSVTVTSADPPAHRHYETDDSACWLERFELDINDGVFGVDLL